jgi:hypothetical protein
MLHETACNGTGVPTATEEALTMAKALRILALVALAALVVSTATGCCPLLNDASDEAAERTAEEIIEGATGGEVDIEDDGGSVTIETEEGAVTIEGGEGTDLPEDWPSDMPVYDGTITGSSSFSTPEGDSMTVTIETGDSVDDVLAFYQAELQSDGWTEDFVADSSDGGERAVSLVVSKGERNGTVAINEDEGTTFVGVTVIGAE